MYSYQLTSQPPVRGPLQRLSEWLGTAGRRGRSSGEEADRIRLRRRNIPAGNDIPPASREDLLIVSGDVKLLREGRIVGMRYAGDTIGGNDGMEAMNLVAHTDVCIMQLPRR